MTPQADIEQRLFELVDGELSATEEALLLKQIEGDEDLEAMLAEFREEDRLLGGFYRARSAQISDGGRPDLGALPSAQVVAAPRPKMAGFVKYGLAAAATLAVAGGLSSIWIWGQTDAPGGTVKYPGGATTLVADTNGQRPVAEGDRFEYGRPYKVPANEVMEVSLAGLGGVEANANSVFVPRETRSGLALELERGEVLVRAVENGGRTIVVETPQLTVEGRDAVFGVVRGLRGAEVAVVSGEVEVVQNGARRRLSAGQALSTEITASPIGPVQRVAWSRHREQLLDILADSSHVAVETPTAVPASGTSDGELHLTDLAVTTAFLPSNTLLLVEAPSLALLLEPLGARNLGELLDPQRVLPELERAVRRPEVQMDSETLEALRMVLQSEEFAVIAPALDDSVSFAVTEDGPLIVADVRGSEYKIDDVLDERLRPLLREEGMEDELLVEVANGFLVAGVEGEGVRETLEALRRVAPTGFANSAFLREVRLAAPDSRITAAVNAQAVAELVRAKSGAESQNSKWMNRIGFENLKAVIAASDFGDQAGNQAMRFVFDDERTGMMSWLAEPGAMGSLRFFSPRAPMITAAKIESPEVMLSTLFGWLEEDGIQLRRPESAQEIALAEKIVSTLGNEVAFGLDYPLLPNPNMKVAVEVIDPMGFHDSMVDLMDLLYASESPAAQTVVRSDTYQGRLIVEFTHPDVPVSLSYAIIDDFVVVSPGLPLTQRVIDLVNEGRSIDSEYAFLESLPALSGSHVSFLMYENVSETLGNAAPFLAHMAPATMLEKMNISQGDLHRSLASQQQGDRKGPTVAYATAEENRIDFYVEGLKLGDARVGEIAPGAATFAAGQ